MAELTFRAVVFDLDGLMLNTEDIFDMAGRRLLERRCREMTAELHHAMLGRRPDEALTVMKQYTGIADALPDLKREVYDLFAEISEHHMDVMPGLTELLEDLNQRQAARAVATSSPRDYLNHVLGRFDLLKHFPVTLTAEDVTYGKPHPEIYLTAAGRLGVSPQQMLVLEDSETGTRSAAAAGAFVVSVPNRHTCDGDFSMASLVVESLADARLLSLLPLVSRLDSEPEDFS